MYFIVTFFSSDAFLSSSSVRRSFKNFSCIGVWSLIIEYRAVLGFPINIFLFLRTVRTSRSFGNTTFIKRGYLPVGFGFPTRKNVTGLLVHSTSPRVSFTACLSLFLIVSASPDTSGTPRINTFFARLSLS